MPKSVRTVRAILLLAAVASARGFAPDSPPRPATTRPAARRRPRPAASTRTFVSHQPRSPEGLAAHEDALRRSLSGNAFLRPRPGRPLRMSEDGGDEAPPKKKRAKKKKAAAKKKTKKKKATKKTVAKKKTRTKAEAEPDASEIAAAAADEPVEEGGDVPLPFFLMEDLSDDVAVEDSVPVPPEEAEDVEDSVAAPPAAADDVEETIALMDVVEAGEPLSDDVTGGDAEDSILASPAEVDAVEEKITGDDADDSILASPAEVDAVEEMIAAFGDDDDDIIMEEDELRMDDIEDMTAALPAELDVVEETIAASVDDDIDDVVEEDDDIAEEIAGQVFGGINEKLFEEGALPPDAPRNFQYQLDVTDEDDNWGDIPQNLLTPYAPKWRKYLYTHAERMALPYEERAEIEIHEFTRDHQVDVDLFQRRCEDLTEEEDLYYVYDDHYNMMHEDPEEVGMLFVQTAERLDSIQRFGEIRTAVEAKFGKKVFVVMVPLDGPQGDPDLLEITLQSWEETEVFSRHRGLHDSNWEGPAELDMDWLLERVGELIDEETQRYSFTY